MSQLDLVFCRHLKLLVAGPEYVTFEDFSILETG